MTQNIFVYMDFQVAWKREAGKDSTAGSQPAVPFLERRFAAMDRYNRRHGR